MYPQPIILPKLSRYNIIYSEIHENIETIYKNDGTIFFLNGNNDEIIAEKQMNNDEITYVKSKLNNIKLRMDSKIKQLKQEQEKFRHEVEEGRDE